MIEPTTRERWMLAVVDSDLPIETVTVALQMAAMATDNGHGSSPAAAGLATLRVPGWIIYKRTAKLRAAGWLDREPRPRVREDAHLLTFPGGQ